MVNRFCVEDYTIPECPTPIVIPTEATITVPDFTVDCPVIQGPQGSQDCCDAPPTYDSWSAQIDDYDLLDDDRWLIISSFTDDPVVLTGLQNGYEGRMLRITNIGPEDLELAFNNSSSSVGNRIITPNDFDYLMELNESCDLQHDGSAWYVIDRSNGIKVKEVDDSPDLIEIRQLVFDEGFVITNPGLRTAHIAYKGLSSSAHNTCSAMNWLSENDCILFELVEAHGICDGIATGQISVGAYDEVEDAWIGEDTITTDGGDLTPTYYPADGDMYQLPRLKLGSYPLIWEGCEDGYIYFSGGWADLCGAQGAQGAQDAQCPPEPCTPNYFRVRVSCDTCEVEVSCCTPPDNAPRTIIVSVEHRNATPQVPGASGTILCTYSDSLGYWTGEGDIDLRDNLVDPPNIFSVIYQIRCIDSAPFWQARISCNGGTSYSIWFAPTLDDFCSPVNTSFPLHTFDLTDADCTDSVAANVYYTESGMIPDYHGPGWYCLGDEEETGGCGAQELKGCQYLEEEPSCNVEICAGPFGSQAECDDVCEYDDPLDPILTDCCENELAAVLFATITDKTGTCTCMPDEVIMTWNETTQEWQGSYSECGGCSFELSCETGVFNFGGASCTGTVVEVSLTCDPFELVYSVDNDTLPSCDGTFTVTITE